jgi:phage shock protein E
MKKLISMLFILGLISNFLSKASDNDTLSCYEAQAFLKSNANNPNVIIIDVRSPEEYSQGHLVSAVNINWHGSDFEEQVMKLDKNLTYIIYCKRGGRSAAALKKMHSLGILNVKHIGGGFDEWKGLGFSYK